MKLKDLLETLQDLSKNKKNLDKEVMMKNQTNDYWKTIIYTPLEKKDIDLKVVEKSDYHAGYNGKNINYKEADDYDYDEEGKLIEDEDIFEAIVLD